MLGFYAVIRTVSVGAEHELCVYCITVSDDGLQQDESNGSVVMPAAGTVCTVQKVPGTLLQGYK